MFSHVYICPTSLVLSVNPLNTHCYCFLQKNGFVHGACMQLLPSLSGFEAENWSARCETHSLFLLPQQGTPADPCASSSGAHQTANRAFTQGEFCHRELSQFHFIPFLSMSSPRRTGPGSPSWNQTLCQKGRKGREEMKRKREEG